jgi:hypothetical protein
MHKEKYGSYNTTLDLSYDMNNFFRRYSLDDAFSKSKDFTIEALNTKINIFRACFRGVVKRVLPV